MKISVCIPTYEMHGRGTALLTRSLDVLLVQSCTDFEVVITDNSDNDDIQNLCGSPRFASLRINYSKNPRKGMAQNTNEAIRNAKGDIIKILYMDDYLAHKNSLQEIADNFTGGWLIGGYEHETEEKKRTGLRFPEYSKSIVRGQNTIGSPSVIALRNENPLFFDEKMTWLLDCDYYEKLYRLHGEPAVLHTVHVVIGLGKHQTTNHLTESLKKKEEEYLLKKYDILPSL